MAQGGSLGIAAMVRKQLTAQANHEQHPPQNPAARHTTPDWPASVLSNWARRTTRRHAGPPFHDIRAALLGKDHAALAAALTRHDVDSRIAAAELTRRTRAFPRGGRHRLGVPPTAVTLELLADTPSRLRPTPIVEARAPPAPATRPEVKRLTTP